MPCKELWLVRHAEGEHNVKGAPYQFDPPLTATGAAQAADARRRCLPGRGGACVDLIVASPLRRALQTARAVFGGEGCERLAVEDLRERAATGCNWRRAAHEIQDDFPEFDLAAVPPGLDPHLNSMHEPSGDLRERTLRFLRWLSRQPEQRVAVVTHYHTLKTGLMPVLAPDLPVEERSFGNCEVKRLMWEFSVDFDHEEHRAAQTAALLCHFPGSPRRYPLPAVQEGRKPPPAGGVKTAPAALPSRQQQQQQQQQQQRRRRPLPPPPLADSSDSGDSASSSSSSSGTSSGGSSSSSGKRRRHRRRRRAAAREPASGEQSLAPPRVVPAKLSPRTRQKSYPPGPPRRFQPAPSPSLKSYPKSQVPSRRL